MNDKKQSSRDDSPDDEQDTREKSAGKNSKEKKATKEDKNNGKDKSGSDGKNGQGKDGGENNDEVIQVERTPTSPALLSQLRHSNEYRQARGLGAGRTGAATFHLQRITALALIPLVIWFAVSMIRLSMGSRAEAAAWLAWPVNAAVMALFLVISLRHAVIGVQIIFEDYVGNEAVRKACIQLVKAIALVIGVAVVAALIHLSL